MKSKPLKKCHHCGDPIPKGKRNKKYCSVECSRESEKEKVKIKIENDEVVSHKTLKKFLVETREEICAECGTGTIWNNKKLILQMDHIDGNMNNTILSNVRLLCPNCHTQTLTWGYKK